MKLLKKEMKVVSRNSLVQLSITLLFYVYAKKHFGKVVVSGYPITNPYDLPKHKQKNPLCSPQLKRDSFLIYSIETQLHKFL